MAIFNSKLLNYQRISVCVCVIFLAFPSTSPGTAHDLRHRLGAPCGLDEPQLQARASRTGVPPLYKMDSYGLEISIHRSNMIQWFPMKRYNVATFPSVFWAQILVIRAVGVDVDHGFGILFSHGMRMEFSGNQQVGHIPENCFMWKYLSKSINRSSYQSYNWLVVWNIFDYSIYWE